MPNKLKRSQVLGTNAPPAPLTLATFYFNFQMGTAFLKQILAHAIKLLLFIGRPALIIGSTFQVGLLLFVVNYVCCA